LEERRGRLGRRAVEAEEEGEGGQTAVVVGGGGGGEKRDEDVVAVGDGRRSGRRPLSLGRKWKEGEEGVEKWGAVDGN
jgi:hypothetical protein